MSAPLRNKDATNYVAPARPVIYRTVLVLDDAEARRERIWQLNQRRELWRKHDTR